MKKLLSLLLLLCTPSILVASRIEIGHAGSTVKTVISVTTSPHGAVIAQGDSLTYTDSCTYSDLTTDACVVGNAGSPTRTSYTTCYTLSGATATWTSGTPCDPQGGSFPQGPFTAQGNVRVCYQGICDDATVLAQHVGDTFYPYITPQYGIYQNGDGFGNVPYPLNVVVGSHPQLGLGYVYNNSGSGTTGTPGQFTCNWDTSDHTKATIDRYGQVTAIAAGNVTATCNPTYSTNAVHGASSQAGWTYANGGNGINLVITSPTLTSQHWYIDATTGGTFYDATYNPSGQCDGHTDHALAGATGHNCRVAQFSNLYWRTPTTGAPNQWAIGPGDIVDIDSSGTIYSPGYVVNQDASGFPTSCGVYYGCYSPPIPSGTAAQHTIIRGHNYAACMSDASKSVFLGDHGGKYMINLVDSQFVDLQCVKVTQLSDCGSGGFWNNSCGPSLPHAATNGIWISALTSGINLTDVYIFGTETTGIFGASGYNGITMNRLHIQGEPGFGINMDDASWGSSNISVAGGLTMSNSIIEWTGCIPIHASSLNYPYLECRDSTTSMGNTSPDAIGEGNTSGYWSFDKVIARYNWQDGFDLLHSGMQYLSITNSQAYGNIGASFKMGPAQTVNLINNQSVQNCQRLSQPVGDQPASSIIGGANYCRGNDWLGFSFAANGTYNFLNNSLTGYQDTILDYGCSFGFTASCTPTVAQLVNNVIKGYSNPSFSSGQLPGIYGGGASLPLWTLHDYNNFFDIRGCPSLGAHETCNTADPLFTSEPVSPMPNQTTLDNFNFLPLSGIPSVTQYPVDGGGIVGDPFGNLYTPGGLGVQKISSAGIRIANTHGGGGNGIARDSSGNIWLTTDYITVEKYDYALNPLASYTIGPACAGSEYIAIDSSDNVWLSCNGNSKVQKLSSAGAILGTFSVGTSPLGIAIDASDNVWVANLGSGTVTKLDNSGTILGTFSGGALPFGIAVDQTSGDVYVGSNGDFVTRLSSSGITLGTFSLTGISNCMNSLAIDSSHNVWAAGFCSNNVTELSATGTILNTYVTNSGVNGPLGVTVDAYGNIWTGNSGALTVTRIYTGTTPSPLLSAGTPTSPSVPKDAIGNFRPNPPSIGSLEAITTYTGPVKAKFSGHVKFSGSVILP